MTDDPTPAGPVMFRGVNVTLISDPGDEDDYRKKHPQCYAPVCIEDALVRKGIALPFCARHNAIPELWDTWGTM